MATVVRAKVPTGHWNSLSNQRIFFDQAFRRLKLKSLDDWYKVTINDLQKVGGLGLLKTKYHDSLYLALKNVYPQIEWQAWKFSRVPKSYWNDVQNQKRFFEWFAKEMKIETPDDWYRVTLKDVETKGGSSIVYSMYNGSLSTALQAIYPELSLLWFKFDKVPREYWKDINNVRMYLQYLADQYCLSTINDWMNLNQSQIPKFDIIKKYHGNLPAVLETLFPDQKVMRSIPRQSKAQLFLAKMVQSILHVQEDQMEHNYRHPTLLHKHSNRHMEFDIFLKPFNMVIEYHGPHHYQWWYLNGDPVNQIKRDKEKKDACENAGMTYVAIPFWWDKLPHSLAATLLQHRQDLKNVLKVEPGVAIPEATHNPKEYQRAMQAWETTMKHGQEKLTMPYTVTLGRKRGYPRCRGCQKLITNPMEPRITVQGCFKPTSLKPFPVKYAVCYNQDCLQQAIAHHNQKVTSHPGIIFPAFDGNIGVLSTIKAKLQPIQLSNININLVDVPV